MGKGWAWAQLEIPSVSLEKLDTTKKKSVLSEFLPWEICLGGTTIDIGVTLGYWLN